MTVENGHKGSISLTLPALFIFQYFYKVLFLTLAVILGQSNTADVIKLDFPSNTGNFPLELPESSKTKGLRSSEHGDGGKIESSFWSRKVVCIENGAKPHLLARYFLCYDPFQEDA